MKENLMRLAMIERYCSVDAEALQPLQPLLADIAERVQGVTALANHSFSPEQLPATAWVSPLHPPVAYLLEADK